MFKNRKSTEDDHLENIDREHDESMKNLKSELEKQSEMLACIENYLATIFDKTIVSKYITERAASSAKEHVRNYKVLINTKTVQEIRENIRLMVEEAIKDIIQKEAREQVEHFFNRRCVEFESEEFLKRIVERLNNLQLKGRE